MTIQTMTTRRQCRRAGPPLMVALLVLLAACAASGDGPVDAGPAPTRPATTTGPGGAPDATADPGGSGSPGAATTDVTIFLTRGETITPVTRTVPRVPRIGAEAVKALVAGPSAEEAAAGLGTAIPPQTRFRDLVIDNGVARVDLSEDFESGGGTLSLTIRLAQVTCTLDQFASVAGVRFLLDGRLVNVFSGNGILLEEPVSCEDYRGFVEGATEAVFPGIWPFHSQEEMDAYPLGADRSFTDAVETARRFAAEYLGMRDPVTSGSATPAGPGRVEVMVGFSTGEGGVPVDPRLTTSVVLQAGSAGGQGPWVVVGAHSPDIEVDVPRGGQRVSSPLVVAGRANVFEGTVHIEVREDGMAGGSHLGSGFVTGAQGELGPFRGEIAFRAPSRPAGAVVFFEPPADPARGVTRATVVRVGF